MDAVWNVIEPYIAALGGATTVGAVIYAIVRLLVSRVIKKNSAMLNNTFNIDNLSQKVAEKLAGKTMNIDVTAVTEKSLKKLAGQLNVRVEQVEAATNSLKCILVAIAKGVVQLKALTADERAELEAAIKALESDYKPVEKEEPLTVVLQPVELPAETTDSDGGSGTHGVNFGDLEG